MFHRNEKRVFEASAWELQSQISGSSIQIEFMKQLGKSCISMEAIKVGVYFTKEESRGMLTDGFGQPLKCPIALFDCGIDHCNSKRRAVRWGRERQTTL